MSLIAHIHRFPAGRAGAKRALVMCGFGGSIWQVKGLIRTLQRDGYAVTALDFPKSVLSSGDPSQLPGLVDETVAFAEREARESSQPVLLVGISLGALIALNIVRRSAHFEQAVLITGGDIVKIARKLFPKAWQLPQQTHANLWQDINMYTEPSRLAGKRLLFVLPKRDQLIDMSALHSEIARQQRAGNALQIIERGAFGHVGTIIEETVLFPRRTLGYINQVQANQPQTASAIIKE